MSLPNPILEVWLHMLLREPKYKELVDYEFPTMELYEEYLDKVQTFQEEDVFLLLRNFLIPSGSLNTDAYRYQTLLAARRDVPEMFANMIAHSYYKRLILYRLGKSAVPPWEGITWVLDLLPHFPKEAIEGLNSYLLAHAQELPDGRFNGLSEAIGIIRARFIGTPGSQPERLGILKEIDPRDFEHLVDALYAKMGYVTEITPPKGDGGRDIVAKRQQPGRSEVALIECKRYSSRVGVMAVRALLGVTSSGKANKGVLVGISGFTKGAKKFEEENPRIELLDGKQLLVLLNEYLGLSWPAHLDSEIIQSKRRSEGSAT